MEPDNGWSEWKNHVLRELERLNDTLTKHSESDTANFQELRDLINTGVTKISLDVTALKTKAGVWGTVGGGVASAIIAFAVAMAGK